MESTVVDLTAWRDQRDRLAPEEAEGFDRVEQAMSALEARVRRGSALGAGHETDLLAITGALSLGWFDEAAERLERLAVRIDHPAGRNIANR